MMDRLVRMMDRDKNFPCICIWSLGNESGYGPAHLAVAGYVRAKDPSRPVHYEGGGSRTAATDICCPIYARVHQIKVGMRRSPWGLPAIKDECISVQVISANRSSRDRVRRPVPRFGTCAGDCGTRHHHVSGPAAAGMIVRQTACTELADLLCMCNPRRRPDPCASLMRSSYSCICSSSHTGLSFNEAQIIRMMCAHLKSVSERSGAL